MTKDIENYCRSCETCQAFKHNRPAPIPMQSMIISDVWDSIAVDVLEIISPNGLMHYPCRTKRQQPLLNTLQAYSADLVRQNHSTRIRNQENSDFLLPPAKGRNGRKKQQDEIARKPFYNRWNNFFGMVIGWFYHCLANGCRVYLQGSSSEIHAPLHEVSFDNVCQLRDLKGYTADYTLLVR
uniref:Integrase zinc-binding domain-containing protein n=1 Tax=Trichuris muris TaxID=70415 RepID=A0A5S6R2D5_TRIMR